MSDVSNEPATSDYENQPASAILDRESLASPRATYERPHSAGRGISRRSFLGIGATAAAIAATMGLPLAGCSSEKAGATSTATVNENRKFDLLIKGGNVLGSTPGSGTTDGIDLGIKDGEIVEVGSLSESDAAQVIDAAGKLVSPSFVDSHTHLDKAFQMEDERYCTKIRELEQEFYADDSKVDYGYPVCGGAETFLMDTLKQEQSDEELKATVKKRISRALDMAIANGTSVIKTNNTWGELSMEVVSELKEEYAGKIDLQCIAFSGDEAVGMTSMTMDQLEGYCANGQVDYLGGYFDGDYGYSDIDTLFSLAEKYDVPLDFHVLETDAPLLTPFDYILDKSLAAGLGERLTCGHLTALDAAGIDQTAVQAVVEKAAQAQVNVTSLCSCNLYLMGRKAAHPRRRGITRLDLFLAAGVNACFASDNIRDAWRPYGNADMLQEALICAHAMQYAFPDDLETIFRMGTFNPAKNALVENYGAEQGCHADLVVLDAATPSDAIISQAKKLYVIKDGAIVAKDGQLV